MKVVHYPLASPNVTSSLLRNSFLVASAGSVNVDVGASATPSFFVLRNLTLPTKWLANATPSWTYDAAGNRASDSTNAGSWSYDNLNRMTASPGATYTNDILGNRLTKGTTSNTWDDLNRMTANVTSGTTSNFIYRADGLRMQKENHTGSTNSNLTRYRYDGQIGVEDVDLTSTNGGVSYSVSAVNRFALGGRGIDAVSRTTSSGTVVTYPLYDVHGNGVGSLSKSGSS